MLNRFRCFWRRRHVPARHYLGGFRCAVCGQAGADLSDMGFGFGAGYVAPMRILFSRENGQLTRSSW